MQLYEAENGYKKPTTAHEAFVLTEDFGFIIEKLTPSSSGNDIVWDSTTNRFALIDAEDHTVVYSDPQVTLSTNPINLWKMYKTLPSESEYSIYLAGTTITGDISVGVGVDVGRNANVGNINYTNTSGPKQEVVIRTNSVDTALTVNGPSDDIKHYGIVGDLTVTAVRSDHCYHENGFVVNLVSFGTGKFVVESTALFHQTKADVANKFEGKTDSYVEGKDAQYSQHIYNEDGVCVVDGCHETTATHVHSWGEYEHDETTHWRVCASCGAIETAAHTLAYSNNSGDTHDESCTVCGYSKTGVPHTFIDDKCACGAQDQNVEQIDAGGTLIMSMGESVNIKFNSDSAVFWSLNPPTSQGADNQYHETISNESIFISNINVEQNTATVTALKVGTNNVHVITTYINEVPGTIVSSPFSIVVSGTAQTATIDPSKYNNQTLGSPNQVDHLVFGEYSKYVDVWEGEPYCIMDQAGKGTIRAYSVKNSSNETVVYILSKSAMIYPQQKISSITAKFKNIKTIDLGNLDFSAATGADDFKDMFYDGWSGLTNLTTIFATAEQVAQMHKFDLSNTKMFQECTSLVGGNETVWSEHGSSSGSYSGTKGNYAYIDGQVLEETSKQGYFTDRTQSPYYVAE
jgi:hypothetical protein